MKTYRLGSIQRKALLLLATGAALSILRNPYKSFKIFGRLNHEWEKINRQTLQRAINSLYKSRLVDIRDNPDGSTKIILTEKGHKRTLNYEVDEMSIKIPKQWDRKWRIVIFDIPEKHKKAREAVRGHLERMGFYKLQKSVFVFPHECHDEIEFLVEFYNIRQYVRQVMAEKIDNEFHLREIFKI